MSENKKSKPAGNAISRLNEMAAALSVKPTLFTCLKKKITTSYNGKPLNPGMINNLLSFFKKTTGGNDNMSLSNLFNAVSRYFAF